MCCGGAKEHALLTGANHWTTQISPSESSPVIYTWQLCAIVHCSLEKQKTSSTNAERQENGYFQQINLIGSTTVAKNKPFIVPVRGIFEISSRKEQGEKKIYWRSNIMLKPHCLQHYLIAIAILHANVLSQSCFFLFKIITQCTQCN